METFVKRFGWTVGALVMGIIGLVHAKTVANVIEARWLGAPGMGGKGVISVPAAPRLDGTAGRKSEFVQARNIFISAARQEDLPDPDATTADQAEIDPSSVPESDLSLTLAGAIYSPDPQWSLAIVEDGSTTRIAQVGNKLKPDAELVAIWAEEAWVKRDDGRIERLRGKGEGGTKPKKPAGSTKYKPPTTSAKGKKGASKTDASKFKEGITRESSNSYKITKALIEEQLQDLNKLGTQARIIPHYKDGKANGFKLVGIRPGSLYSHIGIRSGDVIRGVNGMEINSPTKALQAFEKFKSESEVDLEVTRRGQKKVIHYKITP